MQRTAVTKGMISNEKETKRNDDNLIITRIAEDTSQFTK